MLCHISCYFMDCDRKQFPVFFVMESYLIFDHSVRRTTASVSTDVQWVVVGKKEISGRTLII